MRARLLVVPRLLAAAALLASLLVAAPAQAGPGRGAGPRSILVRFEPGASLRTRDRDVRAAGGALEGTVYGLPVRVIRVPPGLSAAALAARYRALASVRYAEVDSFVRAADAPLPDDPLFGSQFGLRNTGQGGGLVDADIDAPEGWAAAGMSSATGPWTSEPGPPIGIADSGIDRSHPEFAGRIAACVHFIKVDGPEPARGCTDGYGHGTHVAGIAAAATDNATGVAGVSFTSPLLVCKALDGNGFGTRANIAACIVWLHDHGARVINLSVELAGGRVVRDAVRAAWEQGSADGSIVLAAAGNDGNGVLEYPAAFGAVVSVAATDRNDAHASFSNSNADVEVAAPGVGILSTCPQSFSAICPGDYGTLSGTSMATAFASGVAAVLRMLHPNATAWSIRTRLHALVDDVGAAGRDNATGYGRLNLCLAAGGHCTYAPGAQTGVVWGRVRTAAGQPLHATVTATGPTGESVATNADGFYVLSGLAPGPYHVDVTADGCAPLARDLTVDAGDHLKRGFVPTCG
jgi:thermitase